MSDPGGKRATDRAQAMKLRRAGLSYAQIADAMKIGRDEAAVLVREEIGLTSIASETTDEAVQIELERLDALQAALWPAAIGGDTQAQDRILRIMARRESLLMMRQGSKGALDRLADALGRLERGGRGSGRVRGEIAGPPPDSRSPTPHGTAEEADRVCLARRAEVTDGPPSA